ncbi:unnamed protein product [Rotaria sp. Silwood2]|nr:unnamed protein product [Rotaria sp. Silwood2]
MVDIAERYLFIFVVFILCIYQQVHSESVEKSQADHQNKQLDKHEEHHEKRHKIDTSNVYSSPKAHEFLSYDKCMQRMKCPISRKEDCSEECHAGNTEEEIEEHKEITISERRSVLNKKPKQKFNTNNKKRLNKNKRSSEIKQPLNNSTNQSTIKTDL